MRLDAGWAWVLLHVVGLTLTGVYGRGGFLAYLAVFVIAEGVGLLTGHPMTRYVRRWLAASDSRPYAGLAAALLVFAWCVGFVALCASFGPLSPGLNAFVALLVLGVWMVPHFYGDRWG